MPPQAKPPTQESKLNREVKQRFLDRQDKAVFDAIRADERKRCAAAVCYECRRGIPTKRNKHGILLHIYADKRVVWRCPASAIHALEVK